MSAAAAEPVEGITKVKLVNDSALQIVTAAILQAVDLNYVRKQNLPSDILDHFLSFHLHIDQSDGCLYMRFPESFDDTLVDSFIEKYKKQLQTDSE